MDSSMTDGVFKAAGQSIWNSLPDISRRLQQVMVGGPRSYLEGAAVKAQAVRAVARLLKASNGREHDGPYGKMQALEDLLDATSQCVLEWIEAGAAAFTLAGRGSDMRLFPPELLSGCCRYVEALATNRPVRFSNDCQSLATPVAGLLIRAAALSIENMSEEPPADGVTESEATASGRRSDAGASSIDGHADQSSTAKDNNDLPPRVTLELWIDLLGLCLLPFCCGNGDRAQDATRQHKIVEYDNDDDTDSDGEEGDTADEFGGGWGGSGWVARRVRRAGQATGEMALQCPFDWGPGGVDSAMPRCLAVLIAAHVKAAAQSSRPSSVSSLAMVLAVLCVFTAGAKENAYDTHYFVAKEAFLCIGEVAGRVPKSTADAECVRAALIAFKECAEATRTATIEQLAPTALSVVEGVPANLKFFLARAKRQGPKAYSTALSFCREARAAAVACARKLVVRGAAAVIIADPERFMRVFVVEMASPLLLGDAVKALRTAASADAKTAEEGEGVHTTSSEEIVDPFEAIRALREVVMPGAVQRLTKALGIIDRYSTAAAAEVLKATSWLAEAAGAELRPYLARLGIAVVEAAQIGGSNAKDDDERIRLSLRAVRRICESLGDRNVKITAVMAGGLKIPGVPVGDGPNAASDVFAERAFGVAVGVAESEWAAGGGDFGAVGVGRGSGARYEPSIIVVVEAHLALGALLRSGLHVPPDVKGALYSPKPAERLASMALAVASRIRSAGLPGASNTFLDDDVVLLCQGAEVLEAAADGGAEFFGLPMKQSFFSGELTQVLDSLRESYAQGDSHPVVLDACSWVLSRNTSTER